MKSSKVKHTIQRIFRWRPLYIILMVVATLCLIGDLAIRAVVPDMSSLTMNMTQMQPGNFHGGDFSGTDSDSTDTDGNAQVTNGSDSSMPQMPQDGSSTDGSSTDGSSADNSGMPQMPQNGSSTDGSSADGSSTDNSSMPQMPQGGSSADGSSTDGSSTDNSSMPQMPSGGSFPGNTEATTTTGVFGLLQTVRTHTLPIAIIMILIDMLCIGQLLRLRNMKKEAEENTAADGEAGAAAAAAMTADEKAEALQAKRARKNRMTWIAVPVIVVLVLVMCLQSFFRGKDVSSSGMTVNEEVLTENAEEGSISQVLSSYGTLEEEDAVDVSIPGDVTVLSYEVSNGDTVKEGDKIAAVDTTSVMAAITSLQEDINSLDEELADAQDQSVESSMTATVDGRVMAIYAESGTSVLDTMYENEALMLLSLDGQLAVDFETEKEMTVGDSVTVKTSSGTKYTGRVSDVDNGTVTVTITDDGPEYKDKVTILNSKGKKIGSGKLYIHSMQKVTGYTGTVSTVKVSVGDEVESGDKLLTLKDTDYAAHYDALVNQRNELEDQMKRLFEAYETGYVYAESSGVVAGLDDDLLASAQGNGSADTDVASAADTEDESTAEASAAVAASDTAAASTGTISNTAAAGTATASDTTSVSTATVSHTGKVLPVSTMSYTTSKANTTGTAVYRTTGTQTNSLKVMTVSANTGDSSEAKDSSSVEKSTNQEKQSQEDLDANKEGDSDDLDTNGEDSKDTGSDDDKDSGDDKDSDSEDSDDADKTSVYTFIVGSISGNTVQVKDSDSTLDLTDVTITLSDGGSEKVSDLNEGDKLTCTVDASGKVISVVCTPAETTASTETSADTSTDETSASDETTASSTDNPEETASASTENGTNESNNTNTKPSGTETMPSGENGNTTMPSGENGNTTMPSGENSNTTMPSGTSGQTTLPSGTSGLSISGGSVDTSALASAAAQQAAAETAAQEEAEKDYGFAETEICTVTPQNTMSISMTVDELDILELTEGQSVQITLDALVGQSFEGTISSIDTEGTINTSGDTKYTVKVSLDRTEQMLVGMNAALHITLDTKDDILMVPEAALVEDGNHVYVYTSYDEESDTLGDPVEVTTGVSDGENVEITEGLKEGDSYYYRYADTINYTFG